MAITKLVAGAKGDAGNSTGADIAQSVNDLIDQIVISDVPPSDADGRPDGTVYLQVQP